MSQQKGSTYKIILVAYLRCRDMTNYVSKRGCSSMVEKKIWQYPSQIQNKGLEGFDWLTKKFSTGHLFSIKVWIVLI